MGVYVYSHIFLTSALVGGEWSTSRRGRFIPGEKAPGTHWIGGWVDLTFGLDDLEKRKFLTLPGLEFAIPTTLSRLLLTHVEDFMCYNYGNLESVTVTFIYDL
jgi:hypothetical protein